MIRFPLLSNALVLAGVLGTAGAAHASVVWRGDFSTGDLSQWNSKQSAAPAPNTWSPDRLTVIPSGTGHALRVTLKYGDVAYKYNTDPPKNLGNRSEVARTEKLTEGMERWYKWSANFPLDYSVTDGKGGGSVFTQWHHTSSSGEPGSPPILFVAMTDSIVIRHVPYLNADGETLATIPHVKGRWRDFVAHIKFSSSSSTGLLEVWVDGKQILSKHVTTLFSGYTNYLKAGLYRRPTAVETNVIYLDNFIEATSRTDVGM